MSQISLSQKSFWGRYDVRAIVSDAFGPEQYLEIGRAYARYLYQELGQPIEPYWVGVGHDARLHSPQLTEALIKGLVQSGIRVASLGLSTSPIVYFSEHLHTLTPDFPQLMGTVTVTASHNPSEYNGVKFTYQKRSMTESEFLALQELYQPSRKEQSASEGMVKTFNILPDYLAWMEGQFGQIGTGIKLVVDSGNATAGIVAPQAFRNLGCDVVEIFTEPDGRFPNHHPDPCVHKNLEFLQKKVVETGADFGIAFDGDADRLGIIDNQGRIIPGDLVTLFLAEDVLAELPGETIVFDVKGTQTLFEYILKRNGKPLLAPSGHVYMKRLMKEQDIKLGGELSGHIFFRDKHWGFDDALYAACRFATAVSHKRQADKTYQVSDFMNALPQTLVSEEIRVHCSNEDGYRLIENLKETVVQNPDFFGAPAIDVVTLDGLRVNIQNGFFLVRVSGTEPCITLRFEAPDAATYHHIEKRITEICAPLHGAS